MKKLLLSGVLGILILGLMSMTIEKRGYKPPKNFTYIPSGLLNIDNKEISVNGFFMSKYEVSNKEYNEFLADLQTNNETAKYEKAKHQNENWSIENAYMEPFVKHYHTHQAYNSYPVMTISKEGAELYCQWLSQKLEKKAKGTWSIQVRLPVEKEWIRAAQGGLSDIKYGWGSNETTNKKGKYFGNYNHDLHKTFTVTTPVKSYKSNNFGLYNMSGNAAEYTKDGMIKGGSWNDQLDALNIYNTNTDLKEASPFVGFRPVLVFVKH